MNIIVGGIIEDNGKYLLVQEKKNDCYKTWNLPSGHLEEGESLIDGALREIKEETGYDVNLTEISLIGNDNLVTIIIFSGYIVDNKCLYNKSEIMDIKWFTYEEIFALDNLRFPLLIKNVLKNKKDKISASLNLIQQIND